MTMQTDVLASAARSTSGVMQDQKGNTVGRCRVKAVLFNNGSGSTSVSLYSGSSTSGTLVAYIEGWSTSSNYQLLPGEGILCPNGVYMDFTVPSVSNCVVIYG